MFSSYFFVVWFKKLSNMKGQLIQLSMNYKTEEEMACVSWASTPWCTGWFSEWLSLSTCRIRLAMESYKPNPWFPTSLKFSYCKRNLFEWVWLLVVIVSSTQCHITRTGVSVRDYLDSVGLWAGWGREGYHLVETEERRPDHYGNRIPYAGDSVAAESRLSASMHVQICSSLPLTVCAVWVTVPPSVPWFPHNDGL